MLCVCGRAAFAAGAEGRRAVPDEEKRSCILSVDGYANLSEDMTLAQTREAALTNAKRQALAMAETTISSKTLVENFVLVSDVVEGSAAGTVKVLEQKDFGIEENRRYHVWIRAEVFYAFQPHPPATAADRPGADAADWLMDRKAPLTVRVWTSQKAYRQGQKIEIFLIGNRDFYARMVDITPGGEIIQLLPNDFRRSAFFKGATVYRIPDAEDRFSLTVTPPFGEDRIVVYASEAPLGEAALEPAGRGLNRYRGTRRDLGLVSRGISVTPSPPGAAAGTDFYEAAWVVATTP